MFTGIEHFAIASPDPKHLADWYISHLEFKLLYESGGNYFVEAGNGSLIEIIPSAGDRLPAEIKTPGMRHIAITVENFDAAYQQLQRAGVVFLGEPYEVQGNQLVFFSDADGNVVHLIHRGKALR